jgi:hypothetical protein
MNKAIGVVVIGSCMYLIAEAAMQREKSLLAQLLRLFSE